MRKLSDSVTNRISLSIPSPGAPSWPWPRLLAEAITQSVDKPPAQTDREIAITGCNMAPAQWLDKSFLDSLYSPQKEKKRKEKNKRYTHAVSSRLD